MDQKTSSETVIETRVVSLERKSFEVSLRENGRGRFVRITESKGGKRNTVIIPQEGVSEVMEAIVLVSAQ